MDNKMAVKTDFTSSSISQRTISNAHVTTSAYGDSKITGSHLVNEKEFVTRILLQLLVSMILASILSLSSLYAKEMKW
jgi:hypothetical protein